jgi:hypothetical protein
MPHVTATTEPAVHGLRDPDREPLNATPKRCIAVRLDEQVEMITLHAELHESELGSVRGIEGAFDDFEDSFASEGGDAHVCPEGHVGRTVPIVLHAPSMGHAPATGSRLSPCAFAIATPGARAELELASAPHLDTGSITN